MKDKIGHLRERFKWFIGSYGTIVIIAIFLFSTGMRVWADSNIPGPSNISGSTGTETVGADGTSGSLQQASNDASAAQKPMPKWDPFSAIMATPIEGLARAIELFPGIKRIDELVFPRITALDYPTDKEDKDFVMWGVYSAEEWRRIMFWHNAFKSIAVLPVVIQLMALIGGYKMMLQTLSPQKNASLQESFFGIFIALIFLVFGVWFVKLLFELNIAIVAFIKNLLASGKLGIAIDFHKGLLWNSGPSGTQNPLLDAILHLVWAGLQFYFNILYFIRNFALAVLIIILPWLSWLWVSRDNKTALMTALSEIVTNSLMSASHAIVIGIYLTLVVPDQSAAAATGITAAGLFDSAWAKIILLSMVIPVSQFLRNLLAGWFNRLGMQEERYAGIAMAGLGSLLALGMVAKAAAEGGGNRGLSWPTSGSLSTTQTTKKHDVTVPPPKPPTPPTTESENGVRVAPWADPHVGSGGGGEDVPPKTPPALPQPTWGTHAWNVAHAGARWVGALGGALASVGVPGLREPMTHLGATVGQAAVAVPRKMVDFVTRWGMADGPRW